MFLCAADTDWQAAYNRKLVVQKYQRVYVEGGMMEQDEIRNLFGAMKSAEECLCI